MNFFFSANLTSRVVWTLLVEVLVLVLTVVMAMVDTQDAQSLFFYLTLASVVVLNMANGIYQNTVYGIAAKLPFKYTGAVVLGSVSFSSISGFRATNRYFQPTHFLKYFFSEFKRNCCFSDEDRDVGSLSKWSDGGHILLYSSPFCPSGMLRYLLCTSTKCELTPILWTNFFAYSGCYIRRSCNIGIGVIKRKSCYAY